MPNYTPEQKVGMLTNRKYYAYAPDGTFKGEVRLNVDAKRRYEAKGFTFKPVRS